MDVPMTAVPGSASTPTAILRELESRTTTIGQWRAKKII
jgi:hypothetical protein